MARIVWTRQSLEDLEAIRAFIARNAPHTADSFIDRLILAVDRLKTFPFSGAMVPEISRHDVREIFRGSYRVFYRANDEFVEILAIYHSARLLDESTLN